MLKSYCSLLLYISLLQQTKGSDEFLSFPHETKRSAEICCNDDDLLSCSEVELDPARLTEKEITLKGIQMTFSNKVEPNGFDFKNDQGDEAILSYNKDTGNMFGSLTTHDGRSFAIEKCHHGHVWKEYDVKKFKDDSVALDMNITSNLEKTMFSREIDEWRKYNKKTVVTFSVMFYYTPEFAVVTPDIEGYIDQLIDETNQGYVNSKIPVRVKKFCSEPATLSDSKVTFQSFCNMKGPMSKLTNTADAAALLVNKWNYCGQANMGITMKIYSVFMYV